MERQKALTFIDTVLPRHNILVDIVLVLSFSWLIAAAARVAFHIGPVPITGQTFAVLLCGALLGSRRGALCILTYLAQGAIGLPVFAAGAFGIAYMLGPTGGYLVGFIAVAFVTGLLAEQGWDRRIWTAAAAMVVGNAILYLFGLPWLARFVPGEAVLSVGLYPFIAGDLTKIAIAAAALPAGWKLLKAFNPR